jgi:ABC-type microcin C transport system permease subunit YejE
MIYLSNKFNYCSSYIHSLLKYENKHETFSKIRYSVYDYRYNTTKPESTPQ